MQNTASILKSLLESKVRVLAALEYDAVQIARVAEAGDAVSIFYEGRQGELEALDAVRKLKRRGIRTAYVTSNPASCIVGVADTAIVAELEKADFELFVQEVEGALAVCRAGAAENGRQAESAAHADQELMAKGVAAVMEAAGVDAEAARGLLLRHGSVRKAIEIANAGESRGHGAKVAAAKGREARPASTRKANQSLKKR